MDERTRQRLIPILVSAVVVAIVAVGAMVYVAWPDSKSSPPAAAAQPTASDLVTESPSDSPSPSDPPSAAPSPSATKASPKPVKTTAKPKASLSPKPVSGPTPPKVSTGTPPASPVPSGSGCPYLTGPKAPLSDVKSALVSSAGTSYWDWGIKLPSALLEAVAWEESGWQSTIMSCDGGTGTMQVMPATADWMNQQCDTNFDIKSLSGNVAIGAEYLEWLTHYFGTRYFNGDFTLATDPAKLVLIDVVIGAYQQGFGVIDNALANGTKFPNWWYINAVEAFMDSQPWNG
jgi:Transglycosylase SLT domain